MEERTRGVAPLVAWLVSLVVAIVAFQAMGSGQLAAPPLTDPDAWSGWAADRDAVVATVAVLRLLVLAMAWYLVGVTTVGAVARIARWSRLVRVADALSLPVVRRVLQASLGVGLAASVVVVRHRGGPDPVHDRPDARRGRGAPSPSMTPLDHAPDDGPAPPGMRPLPPDTSPAAPSAPTPSPTASSTAAVDDRPGATRGPVDAQVDDEQDLVTVAEGDHLWAIAERHVRQHARRAPTTPRWPPTGGG